MPTYGVTPEGFVVKRLVDIIESLNQRCIARFGADFDTDPDKPNGQINGVMAEVFADLWQEGNAIYNSRDPAKATGVALTDIGVLNYLTRLNATFTTATVTITGVPGTVIPAATSQVSSVNPVNTFGFLDDVTIPPAGTIDVEVEAVLTGPITAEAHTIITIATPINGWVSVDNAQAAVPGRNYETDPEFRMRRNNSTLLNAQQIEDAMLAAILALPGVVDARIYSNNRPVEDSNGFQPHSIAAVVEGGESSEIGQAIYDKKTSSIPTNGDVEVDILNNSGILIPIFYYNAVQKPVYLTIIVQAYFGFPGNATTQIRQNVYDYVTGASNGGVALYRIGGAVVLSQLYTPINYTPGVSVVAVKAGFSPNPTNTADLPINFNEYATFDIDNILVQAV